MVRHEGGGRGRRRRGGLVLVLFGLLTLTLALGAPASATAEDGPASVLETYRYVRQEPRVMNVGGYMGAWFGGYTPELGELNDTLAENGFNRFDDGIGFVGGGFYVIWGDWQYGMFGGHREWTSTKAHKRAHLSVSWGGAEALRAMSIGQTRLHVGALIGGGDAALMLLDPAPDEAKPGFQQRFDTRFEREFFLVGPTLGWHVPVGNWFAIHLKAGYMYDLYGKWKYAGRDEAISGLPSLTGSFVTLGFTLGGPFRVVVGELPYR